MQRFWQKSAFAATFLASPFLYAAEPVNAQIAIGEYGMGDASIISLPLLALSNDQGKTWSYPSEIFSKTMLPKDFLKEGTFYSASCNSNFCIAVGNYINARWDTLALVAVSKDLVNTSGNLIITAREQYQQVSPC